MSIFRRAVSKTLLPLVSRHFNTLIPSLYSVSSTNLPQFAPLMITNLARHFNSTPSLYNSLSDILRNEIEYEKQNYSQPEVQY